MKQEAFIWLTWAVVVVAVLSAVWLASQLPLTDLRAVKALEDERGLLSLRIEPAAGRQASVAASAITRQ